MPHLSDREIAGAVKAAGFPRTQWTVAVAVALAESGGNSDATNRNSNGSTDYGLFQINSVHADLLKTGDWRDPVANARMALSVSGGGKSWSPWVAYTTGRYAPFLPRAYAATGSPAEPPSGAGSAAVSAGLPSSNVDFQSPNTWLRFGFIVVGFLLVVISLAVITGAQRVIPAGKALKLAKAVK